MTKNQVSLRVAGNEYHGWLSVSVVIALQMLARSFTLSLTTQSSSDSKKQFKVAPGDSVELLIGQDVVVTGFVTKISESYSGLSRQLTVEGKSKTVDLVDCCIPDGATYSYKKQKPISILTSVASYYGIKVIEECRKEDLVDMSFPPEGKIGDSFITLLKKVNLLLTDNAKGDLVLVSPGSSKRCSTDLKLGSNILTGSRTIDHGKLFQRYVLLGQGANPLSERASKDSKLKAVAEDSKVRYRVNTMTQTGNAIEAQLQARIGLIRDVSKANAETLSYTVQGWRQNDGTLWPVNSLVGVIDSNFGLAKDYLIYSVEFSKGSSGMTTKLGLTSPGAYVNTEAPSAEKAIKNSLLESIKPVEKAEWTGK